MVEKNLDIDSSDDEIVYKKQPTKTVVKKQAVKEDLKQIKDSIKDLKIKATKTKAKTLSEPQEIESDTSEEEEIIVKKKPKSKKKKQKIIYIESSEEEETSGDESPTPTPPATPAPAYRPITFGFN